MPRKSKSQPVPQEITVRTYGSQPSRAADRRGAEQPPIPTLVRVLGKDITIDYASEDFPDAGQMQEDSLSILIKGGQLPIEEMDTLLHETIHGLDYILDLGLSEHQVRMLATGLIGLFQDNPEFAAFVTRLIPKTIN